MKKRFGWAGRLGGCDSVRDGGFLGQLRLMEDEIESDQVLVPAFIKLRKESLAATVTFSMVNVQGMFLSDAMDGSLDLPLSFAFGVGHHCRFAGRVSDAHFSLSLSLSLSLSRLFSQLFYFDDQASLLGIITSIKRQHPCTVSDTTP